MNRARLDIATRPVRNRQFHLPLRHGCLRSESRMVVWRVQERIAASVKVSLKSLYQGFRRVKLRDDVRAT